MLDLQRVKRVALAATAAAALAVTPGAFASGGVNSGGVNSGGVNGGGGGGQVAPAPAPGSCVRISSFSNSNGYYSVWAAIWTSYSISSSCGSQLTWTMTYLNGNTGAVDFVRSSFLADGNSGGTVDEDWAAFSTPYTVTLTVSDASGATLATQSAVVTTKVPKSGGGL